MRLRIVLAAALVSSCVRSGACLRCGLGEYELLGAVKCGACTNGPGNSFYTTSSTAGPESCGWECTSGYVKTPRSDACEERDTVTVNFALTSHEFILTPADFSLLEDSFAEAVAGALTAAVDSQHVASASFAAHDVVVLRCDLLPAGQGNDLAIDVRVALPRSKPTQLGSPEPADIDLEALLLSDWVLEEASRAFSEGTGREMTVKAIQEGSDWGVLAGIMAGATVAAILLFLCWDRWRGTREKDTESIQEAKHRADTGAEFAAANPMLAGLARIDRGSLGDSAPSAPPPPPQPAAAYLANALKRLGSRDSASSATGAPPAQEPPTVWATGCTGRALISDSLLSSSSQEGPSAPPALAYRSVPSTLPSVSSTLLSVPGTLRAASRLSSRPSSLHLSPDAPRSCDGGASLERPRSQGGLERSPPRRAIAVLASAPRVAGAPRPAEPVTLPVAPTAVAPTAVTLSVAPTAAAALAETSARAGLSAGGAADTGGSAPSAPALFERNSAPALISALLLNPAGSSGGGGGGGRAAETLSGADATLVASEVMAPRVASEPAEQGSLARRSPRAAAAPAPPAPRPRSVPRVRVGARQSAFGDGDDAASGPALGATSSSPTLGAISSSPAPEFDARGGVLC